MPTHGRYHPCIEGKLNEAEQRYLAACAALTEALLDADVVARLMPYREHRYPDGDLPVAPMTRAFPGGPLSTDLPVDMLARARPDVAGERVRQCRAEAEAMAPGRKSQNQPADSASLPREPRTRAPCARSVPVAGRADPAIRRRRRHGGREIRSRNGVTDEHGQPGWPARLDETMTAVNGAPVAPPSPSLTCGHRGLAPIPQCRNRLTLQWRN